tara:strand:- start:506 stop:850 length:345 start_codon:yes stop_codon:yes gene_type:complete
MNQNSQLPKFRYVDEILEGNIPIEIIDGDYKGIVVRYEKVVLVEKNKELHFDYDYDIITNPNNIEISQKAIDAFTGILISILNEQIADMPDDMDILKEGDSEEHRESNTPEPLV